MTPGICGWEPLSIKTEFPAKPIVKGAYRVQLDFEGDAADDYPVTARANVRVTVHANALDRTLVKTAADTCRSLLKSGRIAGAAGFVPSGRSAISNDPDTGNLMCWFLVRVDLLAQPLAS